MLIFYKFILIPAWIISLLGQPLSGLMQGEHNGVDYYLQSGERRVTLHPALSYREHLYEIHYFTEGDYQIDDGRFIYGASPSTFKTNKITVVFVTEDGNVVKDEVLMRKILTLYRAAFILYKRQPPSNLGFVDDTFVDDFQRITHNPIFIEQQVKALFSTREDETAEAIRGILTAQLESPEKLDEFTGQVEQLAEDGNRITDAVDYTLQAAKFANDKTVRNTAKEIRKIFKSWQPITDQGQSFVELKGNKIDLFNALDILSLSVRLIWLSEQQSERTEWVESYVKFMGGAEALDETQKKAAIIVVSESKESSIQRANIILDFVRDKSSDLFVRLSTEMLSKEWVKWSWNTFGKRTTGHLVAGAASSVLLGFTLGTLIYGLDDLYNNFKVGERTDELRRRFRSTRLQLENKAKNQFNDAYDGQLASEYRITYMLESLAAAQMYRLYADGVNATVRQGLLALINPVAWFQGKSWRDAAQELHGIADDIEIQAEEDIGHPSFADVAVEMARQRLQLGGTAARVFLVDDSATGFSSSGNPDFWWSTDGGYAGTAIWTFCNATNLGNSARWIPSGLTAGFYRIEVSIPKFSEQFQKHFTHSAHYTIVHAGQSEELVIDLSQNTGLWVSLGEYYFDGRGKEYVQLIDTTGETSGSTTVVFDAVRWLEQKKSGIIWDAKPTGEIAYDIIISTEMVHLDITMQNTGQTIWSGPEFSLKAINTPEMPLSYPLSGTVAPGQSATWQHNAFTVGAPGIHRLSFQMYRGDEPFGEVLTAYVIVLPEQLKDMEQQIRKQIDDWEQQGDQKAEEFFDQLWKSIQRELERQARGFVERLWESIQRELERQVKGLIEKLWEMCFGPAAIYGLAIVFVFRKQRH